MTQKIGRNDLCPCGSGKKYKVCCLKKQKPRPLGQRRFKATVLNSKQPPIAAENPSTEEVQDEGLDLIARVHGGIAEDQAEPQPEGEEGSDPEEKAPSQ